MEKYDAKRIVVISDTHGDFGKFLPKLKSIGEIDLLIDLGDFEDELEAIKASLPCKKVIVRGNCDYSAYDIPGQAIFYIGKYKVLATHGHNFGVKSGYEKIRQKGISEGCDIVMFGHTHIPLLSIEEDITLINPGSVRWSIMFEKKEFLLIEIDENGEIHYH